MGTGGLYGPFHRSPSVAVQRGSSHLAVLGKLKEMELRSRANLERLAELAWWLFPPEDS